MSRVYASLGIAAAMIGLALASANGVISEAGFDIGFYGLIASSVVVIGGGKCCLPFAR